MEKEINNRINSRLWGYGKGSIGILILSLAISVIFSQLMVIALKEVFGIFPNSSWYNFIPIYVFLFIAQVYFSEIAKIVSRKIKQYRYIICLSFFCLQIILQIPIVFPAFIGLEYSRIIYQANIKKKIQNSEIADKKLNIENAKNLLTENTYQNKKLIDDLNLLTHSIDKIPNEEWLGAEIVEPYMKMQASLKENLNALQKQYLELNNIKSSQVDPLNEILFSLLSIQNVMILLLLSILSMSVFIISFLIENAHLKDENFQLNFNLSDIEKLSPKQQSTFVDKLIPSLHSYLLGIHTSIDSEKNLRAYTSDLESIKKFTGTLVDVKQRITESKISPSEKNKLFTAIDNYFTYNKGA